ncbi:dTDP-glucose 4,6-dehydratase [Membranicola marinus]|uniref:dTDP-glucose 4,6-dehydratase n=1 Tax=Membranihabitans marinus TaxID=1227546 RepID=A0A953HJ28_9BACT|nr:dTDP-glucose 4,6-dehydratase [Membranihabitans marinus]MBY5956632.1 dTDP-glucose 4,6-dehydratase [Membranihabitans marinus]
MNILITGGAGFIGSHVVRRFVREFPEAHIYNLDALTYAGNLENLTDVEDAPNYSFIQADIADLEAMQKLFKEKDITHVIHLAAESHVDRSIHDPLIFIRSNITGTANLLHAARTNWPDDTTRDKNLFFHVSTDEVYGSLDHEGMFTEETAYDPRSPYSASKAASDHLVRSWYHTYGMPVVISNCSNNYGPNQFPEKLIPLFIHNIKHEKPLPVYGAGDNVRDWLYVEDHAGAIESVFRNGRSGETYNIGGHNEWSNLDLIHVICDQMDEKLNRPPGSARKLITFVKDRSGHDFRYAIDASKIEKELGWKPSLQFEEGIDKTIDWYLDNEDWLDNITDGSYQEYYDRQYNQI